MNVAARTQEMEMRTLEGRFAEIMKELREEVLFIPRPAKKKVSK